MSRPVPSLAELLVGPVLDVAPRLLGSTLHHAGAGGVDGPVAVRITEVEAYAGSDDPGSHAYRGQTERTAVMFGPPGRLYVYFTYGMHHCCNVVVAQEGVAAAVLLRAGEVVEGLEVARARRASPAGRTPSDRDLARGPARLCQALGIDRRHDGADLTGRAGGGGTGPVLVPGPAIGTEAVSTGPRVGLRGAPERPWRFWLTGDPTVSAYRPAAPVGRRNRS